MIHNCALLKAGLISYEKGMELQSWALEHVAAGEWDGILLLLEHYPVVTLGRGHHPEEILWSASAYATHGIDLLSCNRGGKTSCHNPGQLVGYPILNLSCWKQDAHWYLRSIEQIIVNTCVHFGLKAGRKSGFTGVWIDDKKVAAIGVAIRRWITSHGFALNVQNDLAIFNSIIPCGIREFGVTSLEKEGISGVTPAEVGSILCSQFQQIMDSSFVLVEPSRL